MENQRQITFEYESPRLEIYEFAPEQGFATSPAGGGMDGGLLGEDKW